jgi:hypothetical protein
MECDVHTVPWWTTVQVHIDSSASADSVTRQLPVRFATEWKAKHLIGEVIRQEPSRYITDDRAATYGDASNLTLATTISYRVTPCT